MGKRPEGQPDRRHQNPGRPPGKTHPITKMVRMNESEAAALAELATTAGISEAAVVRTLITEKHARAFRVREEAARERRKGKQP